MSNDQLDIDLRMRRRQFIEQANARRPRLPGNLKQLGAVGPVVRPMASNTRQAVVKVGITQGTTTGKQLSYLHAGKGVEGQDAPLFGPAVPTKTQFVRAAQQDPHQFRIVVSVPEYPQLDRTRYIELFMAQVEQDLQRPLDWVAANHYDRPNAHTHIVLRGRDREGKDLYMEKHYMTYGLRARASQLLTWMLGPVRQQQEHQTIQAERQTLNGVTRGAEDPDARRRLEIPRMGEPDRRPLPDAQWLRMSDPERAQFSHQRAQTFLKNAQVSSSTREQRQAQPTTPARREPAQHGRSLIDRLAILRETLHRQQETHQQPRHRGQGMGW